MSRNAVFETLDGAREFRKTVLDGKRDQCPPIYCLKEGGQLKGNGVLARWDKRNAWQLGLARLPGSYQADEDQIKAYEALLGQVRALDTLFNLHAEAKRRLEEAERTDQPELDRLTRVIEGEPQGGGGMKRAREEEVEEEAEAPAEGATGSGEGGASASKRPRRAR